jgi:hypothetical protein
VQPCEWIRWSSKHGAQDIKINYRKGMEIREKKRKTLRKEAKVEEK